MVAHNHIANKLDRIQQETNLFMMIIVDDSYTKDQNHSLIPPRLVEGTGAAQQRGKK